MKNKRNTTSFYLRFVALCFLLPTIVLASLISCTKSTQASDFPEETEFQMVMLCAKELKSNINKINDNVFGDDYVFEVSGDCTYAKLNAAYRVHIPYRISNTDGSELIDVAYFIDGSYIGSRLDYEYETYKTWDRERQSLFYIARLDTYDKSYSKSIVNDALNFN